MGYVASPARSIGGAQRENGHNCLDLRNPNHPLWLLSMTTYQRTFTDTCMATLAVAVNLHAVWEVEEEINIRPF